MIFLEVILKFDIRKNYLGFQIQLNNISINET